jgi:RimJ/RimL family protein N-acetyltransferase
VDKPLNSTLVERKMKKEKLNKETKRLLLRPFKLSDGPRVKDLAGNIAIADTTMNIPHPYKNGMAEEWISTHETKFEAGELSNGAIILKSTNSLIGAIGLSINSRFNRAELGYWIAKEYWKQGYCTEAATTVLEYGFQKLDLNKIIATHITRNPASGKVMEKIGMKREGILREHVYKWDKYEDIVIYGILRKEWETNT